MMKLNSNHFKVIRREISNGQKCSQALEEYDTVPATHFRIFLHAPHGREGVYLALTDPETKRGAIMEIDRAFVKAVQQCFLDAVCAATLMERGAIKRD